MTRSTKTIIGIFIILLILFYFNRKSQQNLTVDGVPIFTGNNKNIHRFLIIDKKDSLELVKNDTIWTITKAETLITKQNQVDNLYNRLLMVKKEFIVSENPNKWETYGVTDSMGKRFIFYDANDIEIGDFIFGNEGQDYQHNYIREYKDENVFRSNDNVFFMLNTNPSYWGKKPVRPKPDQLQPDTTSNG
tara:strand:+ start:3264 stop:3833 length:570 start_codon:yes stop_codon:yes gene_type:complete